MACIAMGMVCTFRKIDDGFLDCFVLVGVLLLKDFDGFPDPCLYSHLRVWGVVDVF